MTEFERILLDEIREVKSILENLKSEYSISRISYFENLSPAAVVGADYVAYRFNCSEKAVARGRFDTDQIPRTRNKPIAFIKRNVDAVWQNLHKPPDQKAAEIRRKVAAPKKRVKN